MTSKNVQELSLNDIRRYFADWHVETVNEEIVKEEISSSLERIQRTLEYLPSQSGRVLQIGSSPFFLSSLLERFGDYQLFLTDYAVLPVVDSNTELRAAVSDNLGEGNHEFSYRAFNIEDTSFPFPDEFFDGVILWDILQKLEHDPVSVFAEIHRSAKPGAWLVFCSPNAAYYGNLVKIWLSQNVFGPYSTQEVIDSDYRLFTIPEIKDLFDDMKGFDIERLEGKDLREEFGSDWRLRIVRRVIRLIKRGDLNAEYIFGVARKRAEFIPLQPQWLYKTFNPFYPQRTKPLNRSKLRLPERTPGPSRFPRRICKLCDVEDWHGEDWLAYLDQMGEPFRAGDYHRKQWERAQGLYALDYLGLLHEGAIAVGVGAGTEQIVFYLANRIKMVTATDIYGQGSFAEVTAPEDMLSAPEKYAKIQYRQEHLSVKHMDGTNLDFPEDYFDFAFSFSSIEHFGGHEAAARSVKEMGRVIRPGGAVILATEVILNGVRYSDLFQPSELIEYLIDNSGMNLLEDIDFSLGDKTLGHPVDFSYSGMNYVRPHVICRLGGVYWTSVCLVLTK